MCLFTRILTCPSIQRVTEIMFGLVAKLFVEHKIQILQQHMALFVSSKLLYSWCIFDLPEAHG